MTEDPDSEKALSGEQGLASLTHGFNSVKSLEKVEISKLFRWILAFRDLLIVEYDPMPVLEQMANIVPTGCIGPHVADKSNQPVLAFSILQLSPWALVVTCSCPRIFCMQHKHPYLPDSMVPQLEE